MPTCRVVLIAAAAGEAVGARVAECEAQPARLTAARGCPAHLLSCPSDHPTDECPCPAEEIDEYLAQMKRG
ncbi:hypothetical protein [Streptomyces sp. YU58]|uniref:hypothetical protein n=1 Tax=Streptomyces sp. SX92 TaxID=3158972 RepID=UPI0027B8AFF8|nr:hypothetical protein [Streptomyces coralus]WLW51272.1 hypothetical protein QU709_07855 [Streptomyces coralus]